MTITWNLQGTTDTEIDETDTVRFSGTDYGDNIIVGQFNDSTQVETSLGADKSDGDDPNNNKYISQDGGGGGASQVQINGGTTQDLDAVVNSEALFKVNLTEVSSFSLRDVVFYAFDGTTTSTAPEGCDVRVAEVGDTNFTLAVDDSVPLSIEDQGASTDHDIYIIASLGITTVGIKEGTYRLEGVLE